jgi:hypothetical protein
MPLLLFGGPSASLANCFGLRRSKLLFHFGCCTLRTFTTEATGKLASVIRVDMGVVLSRETDTYAKRLLTKATYLF